MRDLELPKHWLIFSHEGRSIIWHILSLLLLFYLEERVAKCFVAWNCAPTKDTLLILDLATPLPVFHFGTWMAQPALHSCY